MITITKYILTLVWAASLGQLLAQPAVEWSYNYGGGGFEEITAVVKAPGGGFLAIGHTSSDKSGTIGEQKSGSTDVIAVRMSRTGVKLWERVIGGTDEDRAYDVIVDDQNRFVIAGFSRSAMNGTKTVGRSGIAEWTPDMWVICLDAAGQDVWQGTYGGGGLHFPSKILQADNGNYLVAAKTNAEASTTGGVRTAPLNGNFDYWLVEIAPNGDFVKETVYGGSGTDDMWGAIMLRDRSVAIYGASQSGANGTKTSPGAGSSDMWILIVDQDGTLKRQFSYGGTGLETPTFMTQYENGDLFISGESTSPVSGNKTSEARGLVDLWALRINQTTGDIIWNKTFGGNEDDYAYTGRKNINDYIVLAGTTRSSVRGDSVSVIRGQDDGWMIYISPAGELIWDMVQGGDERDNIRSIIRSEDGGWYMGGESNSTAFPWRDEAAGGPFGTTDPQGIRANDGWLAKLECDFIVDLGADEIELCMGESLTLRNESASNLPHTSTIWSDGSSDSTLNLTPASDQTIIMMSVSSDACESADTVMLDVNEMAGLDDLEIVDETCAGREDGSVFILPSLTSVNYVFQGEAFTAPMSFDLLAGGIFPLRVNSTIERCGLDTLIQVNSGGAFNFDLGGDRDESFGATIVLNPNPSTADSLSYLWSGLAGVCATCASPNFRLTESGTVSVTVTDESGCEQSSSIFIKGSKDTKVLVPNAISPNNDGINDRFYIMPSPFVDQLGPLRVFNRWGNLIYTGIEGQLRFGEGWDGRVDGEPVQSGVYTYVFNVRYIDGEERVYQGDLTVVY